MMFDDDIFLQDPPLCKKAAKCLHTWAGLALPMFCESMERVAPGYWEVTIFFVRQDMFFKLINLHVINVRMDIREEYLLCKCEGEY